MNAFVRDVLRAMRSTFISSAVEFIAIVTLLDAGRSAARAGYPVDCWCLYGVATLVFVVAFVGHFAYRISLHDDTEE